MIKIWGNVEGQDKGGDMLIKIITIPIRFLIGLFLFPIAIVMIITGQDKAIAKWLMGD